MRRAVRVVVLFVGVIVACTAAFLCSILGGKAPIPDGMSITPDTTVMTGAPTTAGPPIAIDCEGTPSEVEGPYVLTFQLFDQSGASRFWTCNWLVYEPLP